MKDSLQKCLSMAGSPNRLQQGKITSPIPVFYRQGLSRYRLGKRILPLLALLWFLVPTVLAQPIFNTTVQPAYDRDRNTQLATLTSTAMRCISDALNEQWVIQEVPWARGIHNLKAGQVNGLFPVYEELPGSRLSAPLAVERWYWFTIHQPRYTTHGIKIGAVRESNEHLWLSKQGIEPSMVVTSEEQLIKLLQQGRIDGFIAEAQTINHGARAANIDTSAWQQFFLRFTPLYLALSEPNNLTANWADKINQWAPQCSRATTDLTAAEKRIVLASLNRVSSQLPMAAILATLANAPEHTSAKTLAEREALWQVSDFAKIAFIDQVLSSELAKFVAQSDGVVAEIMILDKNGAAIAANQKLTDYWQGDEEKSSKTLMLKAGEYFFEAIRYDTSSQAFTAPVSWPIFVGGELVGSITLGLRAEHILAR